MGAGLNQKTPFLFPPSACLSVCLPCPPLQVWFQNRRAREPKSPTKRPPRKRDAPVPDSHQGGFCAPTCSSHQGLPAGSHSNVSPPSCAGQFWGLGDTASPGGLSGHSGILGTNVASLDLEALIGALGDPSGGFEGSPFSGFSPVALGPVPAPPQPFCQLPADSTGAHLGDPGPALPCGDWALQGWEQQPPSDDQVLWADWQFPPALEAGMAPQQPLSQHLEAWEQLPPPPAPPVQAPWLNPTDPGALWLHPQPAEVPAGHQGQLPALPLGQDLGGGPPDPHPLQLPGKHLKLPPPQTWPQPK